MHARGHILRHRENSISAEGDRKLLVTFVSSKTYAYEGVPEEVYDAFLAAPSHGVFFNENIRDRYPYRLVDG